MINIAHTNANNPSVRIGSMILIIGRTDSSTFLTQFYLSRARTRWSKRGVKIGWTSLRIFTFLGAQIC